MDPLPDLPAALRDFRTPKGPVAYDDGGVGRDIYLTPSTGSDSNDGLSTGAAVATIQTAWGLLRDGYPDRILVTAGENLNGQRLIINAGDERSGVSLAQRIVVTSSDGSIISWKTSSGSPIVIQPRSEWTTGVNYVEFACFDIDGDGGDVRPIDIVTGADANSSLLSNIIFRKVRAGNCTLGVRIQNGDTNAAVYGAMGPIYFYQSVIHDIYWSDPAQHGSALYTLNTIVHDYGLIYVNIGDPSVLGGGGGGLSHCRYDQNSVSHVARELVTENSLEFNGPSVDTRRRSALLRWVVTADQPGGPHLQYRVNAGAATYPAATLTGKMRDCAAFNGRNHEGTGTDSTGADYLHRGWGTYWRGVELINGDCGARMDFTAERILCVGPNTGTGAAVVSDGSSQSGSAWAWGTVSITDVRAWEWGGAIESVADCTIAGGRTTKGLFVYDSAGTDPLIAIVNGGGGIADNETFDEVEVEWADGDISGVITSGATNLSVTTFDAITGVSNVAYGQSWAVDTDVLDGGLLLYAQRLLEDENATLSDFADYLLTMHATWDPKASAAGIQAFFAEAAGQITPPEITAITDEEDGTATVTWAGGANAASYRVEYREEGETAWSTGSTPSSAATESTIITGEGTFEFRVVAIGALGDESEGVEPDAVEITGAATDPVYPPSSVSVSQSGDHLLVSWTPDDRNVDEESLVTGVTSWTVERSPNGTSSWSEVATDIDPQETQYDDADADSAGTTYYYRVKALGGAADNYSSVASGTTLDVPADPTIISVAVSAGVYLLVSWTDNADDEAIYTIQRSTNGADYSALASLSADTQSYLDTTVVGGTDYWYRVRCSNAAGDSSWLTTSSETTAPDVTLPDAPSDLTATPGATGVTLEWAENEATLIDNYVIEVSINNGITWTELSTSVEYGTDTYLDTTATTEGQHYWYRVKVAYSGGDSAYSNTAVSPAGGSVQSIPNAPRNLRVSSINHNSATVSWADCSQNETGFLVAWKPQQSTANPLTRRLGPNTTTLALTSLLPNTIYVVGVQALGSAGNSEEVVTYFQTDPHVNGGTPTAPTDFALAVAGSSIRATWTDNSNNEDEFRIEYWRTDTPLTIGTIIAPPNTTTFLIGADPSGGGLRENTSYSARVAACNTSGCSAFTGIASVTARPPRQTVPNTPSGLTASGITETSVTLSWTDTNLAGETTRFKLERSLLDTGVWDTIYLGGAASFTETGLRPATILDYRVSSEVRGAPDLFSDPSDPIRVQTESGQSGVPDAPTGVAANEDTPGTVRVSWAWSPGQGQRAVSFSVYRSTTSGSYTTALATVGPTLRHYDDDTVSAETTYYYIVRANADSGQQSVGSNEATITTEADPGSAPSAPVLLSATLGGTRTVTLSWRNTSDEQTGVKIKRSLETGTNYTTLATVGGTRTRYVDSTGDYETEYFYVVAATNGVGDSDDSNELSVETLADDSAGSSGITLYGAATGFSTVMLTWTADDSGTATAWSLKRGTDPESLSEIATPGVDERSYLETGLNPDTVYYYQIVPVSSGTATPSNMVSVRTRDYTKPGGNPSGSRVETIVRNFTKDTPDITLYTATVETVITDLYMFTTNATTGPFATVKVGGTVVASFNPYSGTVSADTIVVPPNTAVTVELSGTGTGIGGYVFTIYTP